MVKQKPLKGKKLPKNPNRQTLQQWLYSVWKLQNNHTVQIWRALLGDCSIPKKIPNSNIYTLIWLMKSQWSRGHLQCSLPSPAVAFQQLMASFEHQSLSPLVLCMKYYDFDSITLFVPVCALASLGFYNGGSFQKRVKLQGWEYWGSSETAGWWSSRTGISPRPHSERWLLWQWMLGGDWPLRPVSVTGGDHFEKGLFVTVTSHM